MMRIMYKILTWLLFISIISTTTLSIAKDLSWWWPAVFSAVMLVNLYFYGRYLDEEKEIDI